MRPRRALPLAMLISLSGIVPAAAQFPPAPQQQQQPPCMNEFMPLRQEVENRGRALAAASEKKAGPPEVCQLLGRYAEAEGKAVKFVETNAWTCGIPPEMVKQMKTGYGRTQEMRKKVCAAAAAPQAPAGPSLSDALGGPIIPTPQNVKPGRGTFDTLTGNVLTR